ncbi:hypothetical protein [Atlantibacter sp.]|uniref:hypothetical protein n=1 Tax=Atlantibacter sp. TaxID=1903473 RepID=UPI00289A3FFB|nr:hypothetical protein [Atlantibacter sp.]
MRTNYFKFDLFPQNGNALALPMNMAFRQLINNNNQLANINGTYYSIHHVNGDVFMFLKANNTDIIKTIDRANNRYQDISAILQANEEVAFASYAIIKPRCIGFSSTIYGPKIGAFATYYDHYFFNANANNNLRFEPISKTITPAQALHFAHMGKINVRLENNSLFAARQLTNFLGVTQLEFDDVESFELVIKPKRSKNIRDTIVPTLTNLPQGVRDLTIAAKQAAGDQAVELHIAASGCIYDMVNVRGNSPLYTQMNDNFNNNADLRAAGF